MTIPVVVVTPAFTHTVPELDSQMMGAGLPWMREYAHSDLPRIRSVLLENALGLGAERILLIDADTVPDAAEILALARHPLVTPQSAVWGLYPLREGDRWAANPEDAQEADRAIGEGTPFRIRTGGLGFCCIHRASLERVAQDLPTITEDNGAQWHPFCVPFVTMASGAATTYYADDGSLCMRLRGTGTGLWCDPALRAAHAVTRLIRSLV